MSGIVLLNISAVIRQILTLKYINSNMND